MVLLGIEPPIYRRFLVYDSTLLRHSAGLFMHQWNGTVFISVHSKQIMVFTLEDEEERSPFEKSDVGVTLISCLKKRTIMLIIIMITATTGCTSHIRRGLRLIQRSAILYASKEKRMVSRWLRRPLGLRAILERLKDPESNDPEDYLGFVDGITIPKNLISKRLSQTKKTVSPLSLRNKTAQKATQILGVLRLFIGVSKRKPLTEMEFRNENDSKRQVLVFCFRCFEHEFRWERNSTVWIRSYFYRLILILYRVPLPRPSAPAYSWVLVFWWLFYSACRNPVACTAIWVKIPLTHCSPTAIVLAVLYRVASVWSSSNSFKPCWPVCWRHQR